MKINTISISDPCFKGKLENIPKPPKTLFSLGNVAVSQQSVAIIGTRKPTHYGTEVTIKLAEGLAKRGVVVVSGLALGIDGIAHRGALNVGGRTIAVQANGLDRLYPTSHRQLAEDILAHNGGIVSEYPPGTPPLVYRFVERNRITSALADAIIVTEASTKSGTMNIVMYALEQGRDVYAVPGNITSPMSSGCNRLIEGGATPIIDIDTFIDQFAPLEHTPKQALLLAQTPDEQIVIELIESGVSDGEELQKRSRLNPSIFSTTLTILELRGAIRPLGANHWSL